MAEPGGTCRAARPKTERGTDPRIGPAACPALGMRGGAGPAIHQLAVAVGDVARPRETQPIRSWLSRLTKT